MKRGLRCLLQSRSLPLSFILRVGSGTNNESCEGIRIERQRSRIPISVAGHPAPGRKFPYSAMQVTAVILAVDDARAHARVFVNNFTTNHQRLDAPRWEIQFDRLHRSCSLEKKRIIYVSDEDDERTDDG